jgi:broad specificity phosphatase PhoE
MTTFYICRHGETENNKNKRLSGWIDTPLTEAGIKDALSAAGKLQGISFARVVSSDMGRAFITAYIITRQLGIASEIERSKELREVNYGDLANQPYEAYPGRMTAEQNANFIAPNGESLVQMQQRVMTYVRDVALNNPNQNILLVAHDGTINAIRASFTGDNMGVADLTRNPHDFVAKFTFENGNITSYEEALAK